MNANRKWASLAVSLVVICQACIGDVTTNLQGHYALDETSGETVVDSSSYSRDGWLGASSSTTTSDPTRIAQGAIGGAVTLDQTSEYQYSTLSYSQSYIGGSGAAFSYSIWINPTAFNTARIVQINSGGSYGSSCAALTLRSDGYLGYYLGGADPSSYYTGAGTKLDTDTWQHVSFVYDDTDTIRMFLNGVEVLTKTNANATYTTVGTARILLGTFTPTSTAFNGGIDDFGIWNRALSADEIAAINAMGSFEGINLSDAGLDSLLSAYSGEGSAIINGHTWEYADSLGSTVGETGGSVVDVDAYVVLGSDGSGMVLTSLVPEPASMMLMLGGAAFVAIRRKR